MQYNCVAPNTLRILSKYDALIFFLFALYIGIPAPESTLEVYQLNVPGKAANS